MPIGIAPAGPAGLADYVGAGLADYVRRRVVVGFPTSELRKLKRKAGDRPAL